MPRIPTRDSLSQSVPRSTGGIVRAPRDFVGPALERAGNQLSAEAIRDLAAERRQVEASQMATARAEGAIGLLQERDAYNLQNDQDYGEWTDKFEKRSKIRTQRAAKHITNPVLRQQFEAEIEQDRVRYGLSVAKRAREVGKTARLTALNSSLDKMMSAASSLNDEDAKNLFPDMNAMLQDAVDSGDILPEQAAQMAIDRGSSFAAIRGKQMVDNDPVQARSILSGEKASVSTLIKRFEGFRSTPYWDVNAMRTGYGSDTITTASGQVVKVKAGMSVSRADAERDLERRIGEFQGVIRKQIGDKKFEGLAPNVQAALTSMAYNYGSLPNSVAKAAKSGDVEKIAAAIEARATDNDGVNQRRRFEEAAVVRGADGNVYSQVEARPMWADLLNPRQRESLLNTARSRVQRMDDERDLQSKVLSEQLKEDMQSDIQSIRSTGVLTDIDSETVLRERGPNAHRQWLEERDDAAQFFEATENLATLPEDRISQVLQANEPEPGSKDFSRKQAVYNDIVKYADGIRRERANNPAQAAMRIPSVTRAMSEAQDPRTTSPAKVQAFVRELIATQSAFGVPRSAIAPIPDDWAFEIGRVFLKFPAEQNNSNRDQIAQALSSMYRQMEEQYGDMTDEVLAYSMMRTKSFSKEMSKTMTGYLKSLSSGTPITRAGKAARAAQMLRDQEQAEAAAFKWWNPNTWGSDGVSSPVRQGDMPSRDEIAAVLTMEDEQAQAEALQALKDRYGEESVSAAQAMYQ